MNRGHEVLKLLIISAVGAISVWGVHHAIGLIADGATWLFNSMLWRDFSICDPEKVFGVILTQIPLIAAMKAGVFELNSLVRIHSARRVMIPAFFWALAMLTLYLAS